jgi:hypothetical protein
VGDALYGAAHPEWIPDGGPGKRIALRAVRLQFLDKKLGIPELKTGGIRL